MDDNGLSAKVTFGKLGVINTNGWILAEGVTGGRRQKVSLSPFNHALGKPFSASGPPVGVGEIYEADGELRLDPKWNPDIQAAREAHSAVKFAFDNGMPLPWSYGGKPEQVQAGENDDDPPTFTLVDFFESSPVMRGAHTDATTLAASRILAAGHVPEGADSGNTTTSTSTTMAETKPEPKPDVQPKPLREYTPEDLKGYAAAGMADAVKAAIDDAPKFQQHEKEVSELRERLRVIENTPKPEGNFAANFGLGSIGEAWAAHKETAGVKYEGRSAPGQGRGLYRRA